MRAGPLATLLTTLLWLTGAAAADDSAAVDALLSRLAQPPPASTAFLEQRRSELLDAPLLLRGTLRQPDPDSLIREVELPYVERTTIRAERVVVEREDGRSRRFALRNAPELAALLDSFRAMLGGNRALLERHYRVRLDQHVDHGWRILLTPLDQRRQRRNAAIELWGRDDQLACLKIHDGDGGIARTLLGPAAEATADDAFDAALAEHCGGPGADS